MMFKKAKMLFTKDAGKKNMSSIATKKLNETETIDILSAILLLFLDFKRIFFFFYRFIFCNLNRKSKIDCRKEKL